MANSRQLESKAEPSQNIYISSAVGMQDAVRNGSHSTHCRDDTIRVLEADRISVGLAVMFHVFDSASSIVPRTSRQCLPLLRLERCAIYIMNSIEFGTHA